MREKDLSLYDFSTSDPIETKKLGHRSARKDIAYLDAEMCRSPPES